MTGKATISEARTCCDPRCAPASATESRRPTLPGAASPYLRPPREHNGGSANRQLSGLLVFMLTLASLLTLYEVAQLPDASTDASRSSSSIRTIRSFYSGLNGYLETGDAGAISELLAPGAWSVAPDDGMLGDDSGLLTYLIALRSSHPQLRFSIDRIEAGDDLAIAIVRVSGVTGTPTPGCPPASGISQEIFRVRDGRIVEHWTTAPASALLHSLTTPPMQSNCSNPVIWPSPNSASRQDSTTRNRSTVPRSSSSSGGV